MITSCAGDYEGTGCAAFRGAIGPTFDPNEPLCRVDPCATARTISHCKKRLAMWFIKPWMEAAKFNLEIQSVVSMRLMKIAAGGAEAVAEYVRMVQEKSNAAAAAQTAGSLALAKGRSVKAATKAAMVPVKKKVRANRKRLSAERRAKRS